MCTREDAHYIAGVALTFAGQKAPALLPFGIQQELAEETVQEVMGQQPDAEFTHHWEVHEVVEFVLDALAQQINDLQLVGARRAMLTDELTRRFVKEHTPSA